MGVNRVENNGMNREKGEGYAPAPESYSATKDSFTIGEVVERLRPEFPTLSVSKIRYLERRRLINLSRTRGGYRLFSSQDIELLRYILTLQDKERSEEHTSELQSQSNLVCRLLLEKKNKVINCMQIRTEFSL